MSDIDGGGMADSSWSSPPPLRHQDSHHHRGTLGHCNLNTCFPSSPMPGEHAGGRSLFIIHYV